MFMLVEKVELTIWNLDRNVIRPHVGHPAKIWRHHPCRTDSGGDAEAKSQDGGERSKTLFEAEA